MTSLANIAGRKDAFDCVRGGSQRGFAFDCSASFF
jgi:hypothetical protein